MKILNVAARFALCAIALTACGGDGTQLHMLASRAETTAPPAPSAVVPTTSTTEPARVVTHASRSLPHPRPTVSYTGDWASLVASLPWDSATAFRIIQCESGGRPWEVNSSSGAAGLFQILGGPLEPLANVRLAFSMWQARGWGPWRSSERCWR